MSKSFFRILCLAVVAAWLLPGLTAGQLKQPKPPNPAQLEVTAEIAATDDDGQPSVLRITLKNVGNIAVDLAMPKVGCPGGEGAVFVQYTWHSNDPNDLSGYGWGCGVGVDHQKSLLARVREDWIRLLPGEFVTQSTSIRDRFKEMKPGTIEYWAEYSPPTLTTKEIEELREAGFVVPTESLKSSPRTLIIH